MRAVRCSASWQHLFMCLAHVFIWWERSGFLLNSRVLHTFYWSSRGKQSGSRWFYGVSRFVMMWSSWSVKDQEFFWRITLAVHQPSSSCDINLQSDRNWVPKDLWYSSPKLGGRSWMVPHNVVIEFIPAYAIQIFAPQRAILGKEYRRW